MRGILTALILVLLFSSCKNRDINEGEEFKPREVNEDYQNFHFNKIVYDGVEYLITERDNNNPHEGFGFMAYKANKLEQKQDSILSYLQAVAEIQKRIYAKLYNLTEEQVEDEFNFILNNQGSEAFTQ